MKLYFGFVVGEFFEPGFTNIFMFSRVAPEEIWERD